MPFCFKEQKQYLQYALEMLQRCTNAKLKIVETSNRNEGKTDIHVLLQIRHILQHWIFLYATTTNQTQSTLFPWEAFNLLFLCSCHCVSNFQSRKNHLYSAKLTFSVTTFHINHIHFTFTVLLSVLELFLCPSSSPSRKLKWHVA